MGRNSRWTTIAFAASLIPLLFGEARPADIDKEKMDREARSIQILKNSPSIPACR